MARHPEDDVDTGISGEVWIAAILVGPLLLWALAAWIGGAR